MANATEFKKTLTDATPFYAFVGAGDLAVEKIRGVPDRLSGMKIDMPKIELPKLESIDIPTDPKVIRTRVSTRAADVQERVTATFSTLTAAGKEAPAKAQDFARVQYGKAGDYATQLREIYEDLAERGHKVVDRMNKKEAEAEHALHAAAIDRHDAKDASAASHDGATKPAAKPRPPKKSTSPEV
ncbi:hypothetical protein LO772_15770 [Yinghuangia sp. ASG 101]|uniref:hypothetical protein n=1 Tax=Yinghuangia sp. ASG 101 TaxID=2896848 RepID=UPI001E37A353|nr:hypothetical protein [Yinghuangia sp. ASG 101]UGQ14899.1 hypothetical protein LO772_15770 [Yinghuangia sp. ASG 101]